MSEVKSENAKGKSKDLVVDPNFVPYGPEWEKQIIKHTKDELVGMLRTSYQQLDVLRGRMKSQAEQQQNEAVLLSKAGYYDMIEVLVNISNDAEEHGEVFPHHIDEVNKVINKYVGD